MSERKPKGEKKDSVVSKLKTRRSKKNPKKLTQADIKKYSNTQIDHVISKIKEQELKFTIILVSIILGVFFIVSYFAFSSIQKSKSLYVLRSGDLEITYKEKKESMGDVINFVNNRSLSDEEGLKTNSYDVEIVNLSNETVNYEVRIIDDLDKVDFDSCIDKFIDRKFIRYSIDGGEVNSLNNENDIVVFASIKGEKKLNIKLKFGYQIVFLNLLLLIIMEK